MMVTLEDATRLHPEYYPLLIYDDTHFFISQSNLDELPIYQLSKPTGVFHGKCWKFERIIREKTRPWNIKGTGCKREWWIGSYIDDGHEDGFLTPYRKVSIVEEEKCKTTMITKIKSVMKALLARPQRKASS